MLRLLAVFLALAVSAPALLGARPGAASRPSTRAAKPKDADTTPKYQKSTPEQDQAALAAARDGARKVQEALSLKLQEIETDHFLVFTDWDRREYAFLKTNLEGAYGTVSAQFDIPARENIFVGKLPVYMFARQESFLAFARTIDQFPATDQHAGYYAGNDRGVGHMAMWKPHVRPGGSTRDAEVAWAYVLTHEFTHAFVARYRTNRTVPTWLHEGVAEVIASGKFARDDQRRAAATVAKLRPSIAPIFQADRFEADDYPVARTLVEVLVLKDRKAFLRLFDSIKDGQSDEEALQAEYAWDFPTLEAVWRQYLKRFPTN